MNTIVCFLQVKEFVEKLQVKDNELERLNLQVSLNKLFL